VGLLTEGAALLEFAVGAFAAVDAHVDGAGDLGLEAEEEARFGLHVLEECFDGGGIGGVAAADVFFGEEAGDGPDVEGGEFEGGDGAVEFDVADEWWAGFDAEGCSWVAEEVFAPDAVVGAGDPDAVVAVKPPDGDGIGHAVAAEGGDDADGGELEEFVEGFRGHSGHGAGPLGLGVTGALVALRGVRGRWP